MLRADIGRVAVQLAIAAACSPRTGLTAHVLLAVVLSLHLLPNVQFHTPEAPVSPQPYVAQLQSRRAPRQSTREDPRPSVMDLIGRFGRRLIGNFRIVASALYTYSSCQSLYKVLHPVGPLLQVDLRQWHLRAENCSRSAASRASYRLAIRASRICIA